MFQTKEYTIFKEQQKQEMKLLKQEMDMMSKESKKDALRKRKEQKELFELAEKVRTDVTVYCRNKNSVTAPTDQLWGITL